MVGALRGSSISVGLDTPLRGYSTSMAGALRGSSISVGLDTPLRGYSTSMFWGLRAIGGRSMLIERPSRTAHTMLIE